MAEGKLLEKHGTGRDTSYTTKTLTHITSNIAMTLTAAEPQKEFMLRNKHDFLEIKKIILNPKFQWQRPEEWSKVLFDEMLNLSITCHTTKGNVREQQYPIVAYINASHYQPVFSLNSPIHIPQSF